MPLNSNNLNYCTDFKLFITNTSHVLLKFTAGINCPEKVTLLISGVTSLTCPIIIPFNILLI